MGMIHQLTENTGIDVPLRGNGTVHIEASTGRVEDEIVDQRVSRSGVEGGQLTIRTDQGHVGDAADVEKSDRRRKPCLLSQRSMIDRHQRRPLPTCPNVGRSEIIDDRKAEALGQSVGVANLRSKAAIRRMMHRLPMKTDHLGPDTFLLGGDQQNRHRVGMRISHDALGLRESSETVLTRGHAARILQCSPQNRPFLVAVGLEQRWPEFGYPLTIGADQRRVDAVHRRTAHQTECPHGRIARHF